MTKRTRLRVVLDRHKNGDITVYADAGVDVFERSIDVPFGPLLQFIPRSIPSGWFARPAGDRRDCSEAFAELYAKPLKIIRRH